MEDILTICVVVHIFWPHLSAQQSSLHGETPLWAVCYWLNILFEQISQSVAPCELPPVLQSKSLREHHQGCLRYTSWYDRWSYHDHIMSTRVNSSTSLHFLPVELLSVTVWQDLSLDHGWRSTVCTISIGHWPGEDHRIMELLRLENTSRMIKSSQCR